MMECVGTRMVVSASFASAAPCCPLPQNAAGGGAFLDPETASSQPDRNIIWRIHGETPKVLELTELSSDQNIYRSGLHLLFEDFLSPFASVIPSQVMGKSGYIVWVVTVGGVAYRLQVTGAVGGWMLCGDPQQYDVRADVQQLQHVTVFAATANLLCLGGHSGSIICIPFATSHHALAPDVSFELKDADAGLSRLWGFAFRGKNAGPVKSLAARLLNGSSMLFALHEDGTVRIWDLQHHTRLLNHTLSPSPELTGREDKLMCVEEVGAVASAVRLVFLCSSSSDASQQTAVVCTFSLAPSDGGLRPGHLTVQYTFSIDEGTVVDMRLLSSGLWMLQRAQKGHQLLYANLQREGDVQLCRLQEESVSEQLLLGAGHDWDDLLFIVHPTVGVSAGITLADVYLWRLLQPGVRQRAALQHALHLRRRPLSDSDLASLTFDGLRTHISAAVETESCGGSPARALHEWVSFINDYVAAWTRNSCPYGLVMDARTGGVGLIRSTSVSVIRSLSGVEHLLAAGRTGTGQIMLPVGWKEDETEEAGLLAGVLGCAESVAGHLGRLPLAALHEALLRPSDHPVPALVASFVRILDVGFSSIRVSQEKIHVGVDDVRTNEQEQHQRQRKFALHMAHSLMTLQRTAGGWDTLLLVISKYANFLVFPATPLTPASALNGGVISSSHKTLLAQTTSEIAWAHFEAARNLLLLLGYVVKLRSQVGLSTSEVAKIQLHIIPQVQEAVTVSLLLHWLTVTFAEVPPPEDFSSQLSLLRLDGNSSSAGEGRLETRDLTLAELLISTFLEVIELESSLPTAAVPNLERLLTQAWQFISWLLLGENGELPLRFSGRTISLSNILLQHGQYSSLERFLVIVEQFSSQQKLAEGVRTVDGHWSVRLHLLGFCLLARARTGIQDGAKDKRIAEAIRCFFRAASGLGEAKDALQSLVLGTGYQQNLPGRGAAAAWRLHYFEWVMQIFEQYKLSEGARQFAHAALEQVDEAVGVSVIDNTEDTNSSTLGAAIKGRLWANVFKFSLDLELYGDAYCAIISNPDEESKHICLRRFIVVLCERNVTQVLCGQELPYAGLLEKVDQELLWKAENSDVSAKPSPYKLLYGFHMHRHNWRRAAAYMYRYSIRVRQESRVPALQEELCGVVSAINALHLVDPANAWFELPFRTSDWPSPSKRKRIAPADPGSAFSTPRESRGDHKERQVVDLQDLEKDYTLTMARMQLTQSDVKHPAIGGNASPEELVWLLVQCGLYDTAFSLLFVFWKESLLLRELEKVMEAMSRNCCLLQLQEASSRSFQITEEPRLLLTSALPKDIEETKKGSRSQTGGSLPATVTAQSSWQALQSYLEKYKLLHPQLPVVVAESILTVDRVMELPLWLVDIFKGGRDASAVGMAGLGANPAALLRIYLDFDRLPEATSLVLEYLRAWTSLRPADVIKRKHMCAVWFPYTLLDRLQCCLASSADKTLRDNLQSSLNAALQKHFQQVKVDSEDAMYLRQSSDSPPS